MGKEVSQPRSAQGFYSQSCSEDKSMASGRPPKRCPRASLHLDIDHYTNDAPCELSGRGTKRGVCNHHL